MRKGKTFIVSGPSGVGKSTVLSALLEQQKNLYFSVSATTRDPRPGEEDGKQYHFINPDIFHKMIGEDEFLEYAEYVGNFYGTPKKYVDAAMAMGQDVILDIEIQGARQVHEKMPEAISVFIMPPSMTELRRRLEGRGTDTQEAIDARIARARQEIQEADFYNSLIVNEDVDQAADQFRAILSAEHCRFNRTDLLRLLK